MSWFGGSARVGEPEGTFLVGGVLGLLYRLIETPNLKMCGPLIHVTLSKTL